MEKELIKFIEDNSLKPFAKTKLKTNGKSIFKTKDAKTIYNKTINTIQDKFNFRDTSNILDYFSYSNIQDIQKKQEFFRKLNSYNCDNSFLRNLKEPKPFWNPDYGIIVVTETGSTFTKLKALSCNVKFIVNEQDVLELERYDIVQVLDCDSFSLALERLPQTIFLNSSEEAYLERHVRTLSGWKNNLELLSSAEIEDLRFLVEELKSLFYLFDKENKDKISIERVEDALELVKEEVSNKVSELNISGNSLLEVLNKGVLPKELSDIINTSIKRTNIPENLFIKSIPVRIDERELEKVLREQDISKFANSAEKIKKMAKQVSLIPSKIRELEIKLLLFDFKSCVSIWMKDKNFPVFVDELNIGSSFNDFLNNPSPISFYLNDQHKCSILTGANSGGKTTLLEHIIQLISYAYLGLPVNGSLKTPLFGEIYYFAKNKGSMSKGAFETLLTQLSEVKAGNKTLILADEIEAVTEPGVAGKMIAASASFFINQGCYLIFATHLGQEINNILPRYARIDGIEAKGLDENFELIVDHNPVLGRLAHSTPELIIESLAKTQDDEYYQHIYKFMKTENNK